MATTATQTMTREFALALGCKDKAIQVRLVALGHIAVCGRCGGSGQYSYCQMHGTTCFGCGGSGKVAMKLTAALLETVREEVAAGKLQPYLDRLARKARVKGYMGRLFSAWKGQPAIVKDNAEGRTHWTTQSQRQAEINNFCCPLSDEASKLVAVVEHGAWDKVARRYLPLTDAQTDAALVRLDEILGLVARAEELAPAKA